MKKCWIGLVLLGLLTGCGTQPTFETVEDVILQPVSAPMQQVLIELPEEVANPVLQSSETGRLYICDGYSLSLQTVASGDLEKTLQNTTGFSKDDLQVMETVRDGVKCYECVWAAAGEPQMQVGRACILDDGNYHYVLTAMADAAQAGTLQQTWRPVFASFRVTDAEVNLNTGS